MDAIRAAHSDEAKALSELAIRSKGHWGYTPEQMRVFAEELTLTPDALAERDPHVLEVDRIPVGYYTLLPLSGLNVELEHLFVEPAQLRRGYGSALLGHARERAAARGYRRMLIQSDPFAEGFYLSHGAERLLMIPTNIPDRMLPLLEIWLAAR